MTSMFDIVSDAASRGWNRARRAASRSRETASPDALARLIEADIIPRLLLNHRENMGASAAPAVETATDSIPEGLADRFAAATLTEEVGPLFARVETLLTCGVSVETIFLELLAPAARRLGTWWDEDACDFVDVTMGLWRLQEIVNALASASPGIANIEGSDRRALFSPAPGEQHGLGAGGRAGDPDHPVGGQEGGGLGPALDGDAGALRSGPAHRRGPRRRPHRRPLAAGRRPPDDGPRRARPVGHGRRRRDRSSRSVRCS